MKLFSDKSTEQPADIERCLKALSCFNSGESFHVNEIGFALKYLCDHEASLFQYLRKQIIALQDDPVLSLLELKSSESRSLNVAFQTVISGAKEFEVCIL